MKLNRAMMLILLGALLLGRVRAEDYFQQGNAEVQNSNYQEAVRLYSLYLAEHPNDTNSLYNRGLAYSNLRIRDSAIADLSRVIEMRPGDTLAYVLRGVQYYHEAAINNMAEEMTQRLFAEDDEDTVYVPTDSVRLVFAPAFADFSKAIALDSTNANAWKMRGSCHAELKEYDPAIADFTTAIRLRPDYDQAFSERAKVFLDAGKLASAIQDYSRLLELKPETENWIDRAKAYQANQEYDKAVSDLTKALELDSTAGRVYNRRGNCYYKLNRLDAAKQDWLKARQLDKDYPDSPEGKRALMLK